MTTPLHCGSDPRKSATTGIVVLHATLDPDSDPAGYAAVQRRGPSVIAIGKFDGIHRGHQALLARSLLEARSRGLQAGVVTFDAHPNEVLRGVKCEYLTTLDERRQLFADAGMDFMVVLRSTPELFATPPEDFAATLIRKLDSRAVVVGADFRFGCRAAGNVETLRRVAPTGDFQAIAVDLKVDSAGKVSSSRIREELSAGHVEYVAELLGRPFSVGGEMRTKDAGGGSAVEVDQRVALPGPGAYLGRVDLSSPGRLASLPAVVFVSGRNCEDARVSVFPLRSARISAGSCRVVFERPLPGLKVASLQGSTGSVKQPQATRRRPLGKRWMKATLAAAS
jgi:riboflavin kinase / FMN adenylyltransferase